jgi:hypothetical protein
MDITNWTAKFDPITERYMTTFGSLSEEDLNTKPYPQSWSIAEIVQHIVLTNESYYPILESLNRGDYQVSIVGKIGFMTKMFGTIILKSVEPERKRKVKTFPVWDPTRSTIPSGILQRFQADQERNKKFLEKNRKLFGKNIKIASPANKNIVYSLDILPNILLDHQKRHFNQAVEVLGMIKRHKENLPK